MVRVYWTEIPEQESSPKNQSKWAYRLFETVIQRQYPSIKKPVLLERDAKGKPFLPEYPGVHMNLSHSGRYVACAIGEGPVGVDIECQRSRKRPELVIKKFHPLEQRLYKETEEENRERLFYDLWVMKESFMKAEGAGLGISLDSFYMEKVHRGTGQVLQKQNEKNYYYRLYQLEDKPFSLAACSEDTVFAEKPVFITLRGG